MPWNWQIRNWPNFSFSAEKIAPFEKQLLHQAGLFAGSLKHIQKDEQDTLIVDLISDEAYNTSQIEGELLNRDSLQSSVRRHFGLQTDLRKVPPAEQGISEMMVSLYQTYDQPLTHEQLYTWHTMLTNGRNDLTDRGRYRTHEDPMQIVSGPLGYATVHFEAPPSANVPDEMNRFLQWFNQHSPPDPLTRAGIAHLYFESIHPFEDGNGRIGRAISEKALSQSLQRPTLIAISRTIERHKKDYYKALHDHSTGLEITDWLVYFCQMVLVAQQHTQELLDFIIEKGKYYRSFSHQWNQRQQKVVDRMFREGIEGFTGGLSAHNYQRIARTTASTAPRDLQRMVEIGAFVRTGERKGTRYFLNIDHPSVGPEKP